MKNTELTNKNRKLYGHFEDGELKIEHSVEGSLL